MPKQKTLYICQQCGYETPQWVGQCPDCKSWNSLEETVVTTQKSAISSSRNVATAKTVKLSEVQPSSFSRLSSGIGEFDRVLGGGFVPGQVIIIAGEPGVGKSTILTQISRQLSDKKILYVCGEESVSQIKLRAQRMGYEADNLLMFAETDVFAVTQAMQDNAGLDLVIIDSIQTLTTSELNSAAGSIGQVRGCTQLVTNAAKRLGIPVILVGHITKQGAVAGPKVLEHIVDTVLYLEGDSQHLFRVLRTSKNRFGPVSEVGMFEMEEGGLREVVNPSELFLENRQQTSGSCITVVMEGYRPILFEIQALTTPTAFGYPRRTASGFSVNRLQVLIAILEKRCGLNLSNQDVYVSIAGGFKVAEYAADLAVCCAIASSLKDKPIDPKTVVYGECGLSGEVRRVPHEERRAQEAKKLGFTGVVSASRIKSVSKALAQVL